MPPSSFPLTGQDDDQSGHSAFQLKAEDLIVSNVQPEADQSPVKVKV